jgi:hypothetical protein
LKTKLATSVSTTGLAVTVGGEVNTALPMDAVYEIFGFLCRARLNSRSSEKEPLRIRFAGSLTGCGGTRSFMMTIVAPHRF